MTKRIYTQHLQYTAAGELRFNRGLELASNTLHGMAPTMMETCTLGRIKVNRDRGR
ncbi:MAG: hypothetical protein AAFV19_19445 [Pseudomonadota bacterium]